MSSLAATEPIVVLKERKTATSLPQRLASTRCLSRLRNVADDGRGAASEPRGQSAARKRILADSGLASIARRMDRLFAARSDSAVVFVSRRRGPAVFARQPSISRTEQSVHVAPCLPARPDSDLSWESFCALSIGP